MSVTGSDVARHAETTMASKRVSEVNRTCVLVTRGIAGLDRQRGWKRLRG